MSNKKDMESLIKDLRLQNSFLILTAIFIAVAALFPSGVLALMGVVGYVSGILGWFVMTVLISLRDREL